MNAITPIASKIDLTGLLSAIAQADADDSMSNPLTPAQWDTVSAYLQPYAVPVGHVLFSQGATDRTLYLVESGSLSVHYQDEKERLRLAIVGPGSVVGEGAFFSMRPQRHGAGQRADQAVDPDGFALYRADQPPARHCAGSGHGRRGCAGETAGQPPPPRCSHLTPGALNAFSGFIGRRSRARAG